MIRVLLADDHGVVRDGLARLLGSVPDIEVVAAASDGDQAVELAREHRPDVVLMDLRMPRMGGSEATRRLLESDPFTAAPHFAGAMLNVQWLADLIFHGFEAAGGLSLVIAGTAGVALAAGLSATAPRWGRRSPLLAGGLTLGTIALVGASHPLRVSCRSTSDAVMMSPSALKGSSTAAVPGSPCSLPSLLTPE